MRLLVSVALVALLVSPVARAAEGAMGDRRAPTETMARTAKSPAAIDADLSPVVLRAVAAAAAPAPDADGPVLAQASDGSTPERPDLGGLRLDVGRDRAALGRLPSDPRTTYGEVGLSIDLGGSLSLTPSYRMNLTGDEDEDGESAADHALKLGASFKF